MTAPTGLWHGEVVASDDGRLSVRIPRLTGDVVHTGVRFLLSPGIPAADLDATSITVGEEEVALRPYQAGDQVLVGLVEGYRDRWVVLGRLS